MDIVNAMVERTQLDMEARSGSEMTPLLGAAVNSHLPVVQNLCEQGASVVWRDRGGRTPLHMAVFASRGNFPAAQYVDRRRVQGQ